MHDRGGEHRVGTAFGLTVEVEFPCPGLPPRDQPHPCDARLVRVGLAHPGESLPDAFPTDAEALWTVRHPDGHIAGFLGAHPVAGYLFQAEGYGDFHITADAAVVRCAPSDGAAWSWQRYLVGQVLPLVAILRGLEVFHASVVGVGSVGVAFLGGSRSGKSTLATMLVTRGARFVTDDVVAVERDPSDPGGPPLAHPGFGLASLRHSAAPAFSPDALNRIADRIGADAEATRFAIPVDPAPVRIDSLFFLRHVADVDAPTIEPLSPLDPGLLLGSVYNSRLRTPARLLRHLDLSAALAASSTAFRVNIGPRSGPEAVAEAVESHAPSFSR